MIENKNKANCYDENWPNFDVMVAKALEVWRRQQFYWLNSWGLHQISISRRKMCPAVIISDTIFDQEMYEHELWIILCKCMFKSFVSRKKKLTVRTLWVAYIECNTMRWTRWTNYMELFDFSMGIMKNMRQFSFVSRFTIESGLSIVRYTSFFSAGVVYFPCGMLVFAYHVLCALFSNGEFSMATSVFFHFIFLPMNFICSTVMI